MLKRRSRQRSSNPLKDTLGRGRGRRRDDRPGDRDPADRAAPEPPRAARPARVRDRSATAWAPGRSSFAPETGPERPAAARARGRCPRRRGNRREEVSLDGAGGAGGNRLVRRRQDRPRARRNLRRSALRRSGSSCRAAAFASIRHRGCSASSRSASGGARQARGSPAAQPGDRPRRLHRRAGRSRAGGPRDPARAGARRRSRPQPAGVGRNPARRAPARPRRRGQPPVRRRPSRRRIRLAASARARARTCCSADSRAIGERSGSRSSAPPIAASADFALIDEVAPSTSPAWFVRQLPLRIRRRSATPRPTRCSTRRATRLSRPSAALLAQAAARIDDAQLFIPITAPMRWSLVSNRIQGFAGNRYARHTLTGLARDEQPEDHDGNSDRRAPALPRLGTRPGSRSASGSRRWRSCSSGCSSSPGSTSRSAST